MGWQEGFPRNALGGIDPGWSAPLVVMGQTSVQGMTILVGNLTYVALAIVAGWGVYCIVMIWLRVGQKRFASLPLQDQWIEEVSDLIDAEDEAALAVKLQGDVRALPQLVELLIPNRKLGDTQLRRLLVERFQRDVLSDLDHRLSWVNTVIKSAPMLGLFGTVIGMMGAFGQLASAENVRPDQLAENISIALITTAIGLAIAIPLLIGVNSINIRISRLEDYVESGLRSLLDRLESSRKKGKWQV